MISDSITNFKTVASFAHQDLIVVYVDNILK